MLAFAWKEPCPMVMSRSSSSLRLHKGQHYPLTVDKGKDTVTLSWQKKQTMYDSGNIPTNLVTTRASEGS